MSLTGSLVIRQAYVIIGFFLALGVARAAVPGQTGGLVPPRSIDHPVTPGMVPDLLFFERKHDLKVGDRGEDIFDVRTSRPACGETVLAFDHARIIYKHQRFGEAEIVRSPPAGCTASCSPLVVRWYHEPTGSLIYQVHVYRKRIAGKCNAPP